MINVEHNKGMDNNAIANVGIDNNGVNTVWMDKAKHLIEALPYIRRFHQKYIVIKYGGAAMHDLAALQNVMRDIALLHYCGIKVVIVHGGGPEISHLCKRLQLSTEFINGQRKTDTETMTVTQMVLLGKINATLVTELNLQGMKAVGISGHDARFIQAKKFVSTEEDLGLVGEVTSINTELMEVLLAAHFTPVIAPIGVDASGQAYNINADVAAGAVAAALKAEKLVLLSDINGVYADCAKPETQISVMNAQTVKTWVEEGRIKGGMIPKLRACLQALEGGVPNAHILNGKIPHSLLLEMFTDEGIGTMVTNND
jgi:acetylglutamate kinase